MSMSMSGSTVGFTAFLVVECRPVDAVWIQVMDSLDAIIICCDEAESPFAIAEELRVVGAVEMLVEISIRQVHVGFVLAHNLLAFAFLKVFSQIQTSLIKPP